MPNDVKIRLLRREDQYGYYLLPFKPDNPARPAKVAVKRGRQLYVGEAWVALHRRRGRADIPRVETTQESS
jgi:hypothetical protein